jgi:hypothetical protein
VAQVAHFPFEFEFLLVGDWVVWVAQVAQVDHHHIEHTRVRRARIHVRILKPI